jgi:Arabinose efflux permease
MIYLQFMQFFCCKMKGKDLMNKNRKHWVVLVICCGLSASSIGICVNAAGVFYAPVAQSLGVLRGTIALQTTFTLLSMSIISLFVPKIMRKYRFKNLLWVHVIIAGLTTIAMALSRNIVIFQLLGFIRGFSAGLFAVVPLTIIINHWFDKHHGLATSIVLSFSGVAGAVLSPVFAACIESIGWEATYVVVGVIFILLCLPALVIPFSVSPRDEGLLPYGFIEKEEEASNITQDPKSFNFLQISFVCFFTFSILHTAITGITQHLPGFAETMQYSASIGAMLLSAGMLGNIFYKLSIGVVSDRLGPLPASMIMIVINIVSIILILLMAN